MKNEYKRSIYDFSPSDDNDIYLNGYLRSRFSKMHPEVKITRLPQNQKLDGIYLLTEINGEVGPFDKVDDYLLGYALVQPCDYPNMCAIDLEGNIVIDPAQIHTRDDLFFLISNAPLSMEKYGLFKTIQHNIPTLTDSEYQTALKNAMLDFAKRKTQSLSDEMGD